MRILSNVNILGTLDLDNVQNAAADTDRFLVQDANGVVKFRTGAEVASDIGASVGFVSTVKHEVKLGEAIATGQAVYVTSADGTNMIVSKASNATDATSSKTLGLIQTGGITNDIRYVITEGLLAGLNTSTAVAGDPVWLGTNGNLLFGTANKPVAPAHMVFIGIVTRVQSNNGEIFVKVQNGFELEELHNVLITGTPVDKAVIQYDTASGLWKNSALSGVTGSGTTNYLPRFTGASTLGNSTIFQGTRSLGFNTATPVDFGAGTYNFHLHDNGIPLIQFTNSTTGQSSSVGIRIQLNDNDLLFINSQATGVFRWNTNGAERMRLHSTGNLHLGGTSDNGLRFQVTGDGYFSGSVAIGTTSAVGKVDIYRASTNTTAFAETQMRLVNSGTSTLNQRVDLMMRWEDGTYNGSGGISMVRESATARNGSLVFSSINSSGNPTEGLRLDASGNLGLGVTPSAWDAGYKVLQYTGGNLASYSTTYMELMQNARWNSAYYYVNNGFASEYMQFQGKHQWFTAPSGTAGNAITFTEVMTLDSIGRLGIGTATPTQLLHVSKNQNSTTQILVSNTDVTNTSSRSSVGVTNGTVTMRMDAIGTSGAYQAGFIGTTSNHPVYLWTNGTERGELTTSGNLKLGYAVGSADAGFKLDVNGTMRVSGNAQFGTGFYWDNTNNRLGIGIGTPTEAIHLLGVNPLIRFANTSTTSTGLYFSVENAYIVATASTNAVIDGTIAGDIAIRTNNKNILFSNDGGTTAHLKIASTGAATFSSSVTANSFIKTGGLSTEILRADGQVYLFPLAISSPSAGQVLKYNGTSWVNDSDAGITGSGTTNYLPKFTGASTLGNSLVFDNGSSVVIGTNTPATNYLLTLRTQLADYTKVLDWGTSVGGSWGNLTINTSAPYETILNSGAWNFNIAGTQAARISTSRNFIINNPSVDNGLRFQVTGDGYFSGNLGVGGSTPTDTQGYGKALEISSASFGGSLYVKSSASATFGWFGYDYTALAATIGAYGASTKLQFNAGTGAVKMTLDASGNLGLGVVPSAWQTSSTTKAIEIGSLGNAIYGIGAADIRMTSNAYYDGVYRYAFTGALAGVYQNSDGTHKWFNAPSGTAGNAITFTQAMTLNSSGQLLVGTTTNYGNGGKLIVQNGSIVNGSANWNNSNTGNAIEIFGDNNSNGGTIWSSANGNLNWGNISIAPLGGNVLIGTYTNAGYRLDVNGTIRVSGAATFSSSIQAGADISVVNSSSPSFILNNQSANGRSYRLVSKDDGLFAIQRTGIADLMFLNESGNLGLGVVPSAWSAVSPVMQFGSSGAFIGGQGAANVVRLGVNTYYNGTNWVYTNSNYASWLETSNGAFYWVTAPSGTAGQPITLTQAMTLDASGRLALGRTTADHRLDVQGAVLIRNTSGNASFYLAQEADTSSSFYQYNNGTLKNLISSNGFTYFTGGNVAIGTTTNAGFKLDVNGIMRVSEASYLATSSGTVSIGTTTTDGALNIWSKSNSVAQILGYAGTSIQVPAFGFYATNINTLDGGLDIKTSNNGVFTTALSLSHNQAATFSNSVTAQSEFAYYFQRTSGTPSDLYSWSANSVSAYLYNHTTSSVLTSFFEDGNVGIGTTTNAGYKLDVNGTMRVSGNGKFTGDVTINKTSPLIITDASSGGYYGGLSIRLAGTENVRFAANSTEGGYVYSPTAQWNGFSILNDATTFFRIASTGAATFSSSVTAGFRTILAGGYIADLSGSGNDTGIAFGAGAIFSVNGSGASATKNIGSSANPWGNLWAGAATFSSSIQAGGGTTNASAILQADSTTKGFLPPRMTAAQRAAISTPAEGLIVVQTDGVVGLYIYINSTWRSLTMV